MALRMLLLRNKLEKAKKTLEERRSKDEDFQKREAELEAAIEEVTDEISEEDKKELEAEVEKFEKEKAEHGCKEGVQWLEPSAQYGVKQG